MIVESSVERKRRRRWMHRTHSSANSCPSSLADETRRNYGLSVEARRAEKKNMELALEEEGRFWNKVSGQRRANTLLRSASSTADLRFMASSNELL